MLGLGLAWLLECVGWWTCLVSCQASYFQAARAQPGGLPYVTIPSMYMPFPHTHGRSLHTQKHKLSLYRNQLQPEDKKQIHNSTFFTRASSARTQTACLHRRTVDGARLGSCGTRSDSTCCSAHGLSGGRKSGWPWCLIQLITRWSQSRRLDREAGLARFPPLIPTSRQFVTTDDQNTRKFSRVNLRMKKSLVAFFWRSLTKWAVKFIFDGGTWSVAGK